jgi:hypothetical protein
MIAQKYQEVLRKQNQQQQGSRHNM